MRCTTAPLFPAIAAAGVVIALAGCESGMSQDEYLSLDSGGAIESTRGASDRQPTIQDRQPGDSRMTPQGGRLSMEQCDRFTEGWPAKHKEAIKKTSDKYGPPSEGTASAVVWHDAGPFKCIKVMREEAMHNFPAPHPDFLEHTISYRIPAGKVCDLTECDGSLYVDRTGGWLSAKCDSEAHNLLGFNIANDIFTGKKTAQQGREAYTRIVMDEMQGKSHPYLEQLQFQPMTGGAADPDRPTADMKGKKEMPMKDMPMKDRDKK